MLLGKHYIEPSSTPELSTTHTNFRRLITRSGIVRFAIRVYGLSPSPASLNSGINSLTIENSECVGLQSGSTMLDQRHWLEPALNCRIYYGYSVANLLQHTFASSYVRKPYGTASDSCLSTIDSKNGRSYIALSRHERQKV